MLSKSVLDSLSNRDTSKLPNNLKSSSASDNKLGVGVGAGESKARDAGNEYNYDDDPEDGDEMADYSDDEEDMDDDDEDGDDDEEEEDDDIGSFGLNVADPDHLLNSLTRPDNDQKRIYFDRTRTADEVSHFNNLPFPTLTRNNPNPTRGFLDGNAGAAVVRLPGPPRDLETQIIKPRFVTLSWMEPSRHPDEVVSYTVFYKMSSSDRYGELGIIPEGDSIEESVSEGRINFRVSIDKLQGTKDNDQVAG